jgi:ribonuclease BN (tRNA processing enzyme)
LTPVSKNKSQLKVVFRGVRGSHSASGKNFLKYGGNTTCYEIWAGNCLIIVDAGSGIISLGHDLAKRYSASGTSEETRTPIESIILFSHVHVDHLQGFPFFTPIYMPQSTFYIYGPDTVRYTFEEAVDQYIMPPYYPVSMKDMNSLKLFRSINQIETIYWSKKKGIPIIVNKYRELDRKIQAENDLDIQISSMKNYAHPYEGVLIFKIEYKNKSIVIASDTEGYVYGDTRLIQFAKNADLLIHDAGYTKNTYKSLDHNKQGYGHSTMEMAVEVAKKAKVRSLALVHHDPEYNDSVVAATEKNAKKLFPHSFAAYENQEIIV